MRRFLVIALSLLSFSVASAQVINFTGDTTQRVNNRYRIAFPNGTPYIVPPASTSMAAFPIAGLSPVSSVNGSTGAVTITRSNLTGTQSVSTITGLSTVATSGSFPDLLNRPTTVATSGLTDAATTTQVNAKEPTITAGTAGQYWRGDKTFQTLNSAAVGLGNLTNSLQVINAGGAVSMQTGTLATRPAAATAGRIFTSTDNSSLYYDNGSSWALMEPALSGDLSMPAGTTVATLATVNANVGTFGAANVVAVPTVNAKGLVTAVTSTTITPLAIGTSATKDFVLSAATNGTILTHNLTTQYGLSSPRLTAMVYQNNQPDYNVYVVRNDDNSVRLVTPLKSDGTNETVTGYVRVWVSQ